MSLHAAVIWDKLLRIMHAVQHVQNLGSAFSNTANTFNNIQQQKRRLQNQSLCSAEQVPPLLLGVAGVIHVLCCHLVANVQSSL